MCLLIPACQRWTGVGTQFQLPEGTTLTVESISVGGPHFLPGHNDGAMYPTTGSSLGLWTHQTGRPDHQWSQDVYLTVADEGGVVHLPQGSGYYTCLTTNCLGERMELHCFDAFPRHAAKLTFFVHMPTNNEWMVAGSFTLPNPARGPYSVWSPEPLPATRQSGNLAFTLSSVTVRTNLQADAGTAAQFSIVSNGVAASGWRVESLRYSDATSNQMNLWSGDRECTVSDQGLFTAKNLWLDPDEPAWKVRAEFSHQAGYGPEELATITNVPANLDGSQTPGAFQATLKDARVSVEQIKIQTGWGEHNATVQVRVTPELENFRIALIKVTNERGQDIAMMKPSSNDGNVAGRPFHFFHLNLPADTKSLNFSFAYQESRFAEFVFKPTVAAAPAGTFPARQ